MPTLTGDSPAASPSATTSPAWAARVAKPVGVRVGLAGDRHRQPVGGETSRCRQQRPHLRRLACRRVHR
eukprot:5671646-Pleurochrysis_carterae.AAC.1